MAEHDPGFARVYLAEMRYLVDRLKSGDPALRAQARAMVSS